MKDGRPKILTSYHKEQAAVLYESVKLVVGEKSISARAALRAVGLKWLR